MHLCADSFFLLAAAVLTMGAALLHIVVILVGPRAYQWCGAGSRMVAASAAGRRYPDLVTAAICAVLLAWSMYALSGAGIIGALPQQRSVLICITAVFLLRAVAGPFVLASDGRSARFAWSSSAACLLVGLAYLSGVVECWNALHD